MLYRYLRNRYGADRDYNLRTSLDSNISNNMYDALREKPEIFEFGNESRVPLTSYMGEFSICHTTQSTAPATRHTTKDTAEHCHRMTRRDQDGDNDEHTYRGLEELCEHLESVEMKDESSFISTDSRCSQRMCYTHVDRVTSCCASDMVTRAAFSQDVDGDTLLHSAIITLREDLALEFINIAPSCRWLNIENRLKQTPLHLAVLTNQLSTARRLVVAGADVTARDCHGNTALHVACREGLTEMARALMEPVRYPKTKQNGYDIPYQRLPQNLQLVNYEGFTVLHLGAMNGHADIVELLVNKHADINSKDVKSGRTVLHMACEGGNLAMVRLLLKHKSCDFNARTYSDLTPFDLARDRGHTRISYELAVVGAEYEDENDMDDY